MSVWQKIGNWLRKLWEGIFAGLKWIWDLLKPAFEGVFKAIASLGSSVLSWLFGVIIFVFEAVSEAFGSLFEGFFDTIIGLVPTDKISLAGVFSPNQQALAWVVYDYCALDILFGRFALFLSIAAGFFLARFSVWLGRKLISIVRGAGV